jgi:organic hydroperoxide reductase OsmC/OhrA
MTTADAGVSFTLTLRDGYAFSVDFGHDIPSMTIDERPPLGQGEGPDPSRLLAASLAGCLGASLLFCLRKSRVEVQGCTATVNIRSGRNDKGRLRVQRVQVTLHPTVAAAQVAQMSRCLEVFEDFCVVTAAVRDGIAVDVAVEPVPV